MKKAWIFTLILVATLVFCSGCSKNMILNTYDNVTKTIGDLRLTNDIILKGKREFGIDHYVGSYDAEYEEFSGKEILFGGTTIERKNGNIIHVKINIDSTKGKIIVLMNLKGKKKILADSSGTYEFDINVKDGSNYLIVIANEYYGSLRIDIIDKKY